MTERPGSAGQELMEAFARFRRLHWQNLPGVELKPREIRVLHLIRAKIQEASAGATVSEVSEALGVTPPTVTQLVNELEAEGLVERAADPADRRVVRLTVTDKGGAALDAAHAVFHASFDGLVEYLGEEDSRALTGLLSKVFTYFEQRRW